jgi:hypothetical protein
VAAGNGVAPGKISRALDRHAAAQEGTLAEVIGETVALRLGEVLAQVLPGMPWNPGCLFCVLAAKAAARDYEIACMNAAQAGEPPPAPPPEPQIEQAVTWVHVVEMVPGPDGQPHAVSGVVPAGWRHVQVPQAPPRQTGLVTPDGRPVLARS